MYLKSINIRNTQYIFDPDKMPELSSNTPLIIYFNIKSMDGGYLYASSKQEANSFCKKMPQGTKFVIITSYNKMEKTLHQIKSTKEKKIVWDTIEKFLQKYSMYEAMQ